jgi:hypothetical protein
MWHWSAKVCYSCATIWHVSAEVDLSGPATWHVGGTHMMWTCQGLPHAIWHLPSLLCTTHMLPSGSNADVACDVDQSGPVMCLWVI